MPTQTCPTLVKICVVVVDGVTQSITWSKTQSVIASFTSAVRYSARIASREELIIRVRQDRTAPATI